MTSENILSTKEATKLIGVKSTKFITRLVQQEKIEPINPISWRNDGTYLFDRNDILAYREKKPKPEEYQVELLKDKGYRTISSVEKEFSSKSQTIKDIIDAYDLPREKLLGKTWLSENVVKTIETALKLNRTKEVSYKRNKDIVLLQKISYNSEVYRVVQISGRDGKIHISRYVNDDKRLTIEEFDSQGKLFYTPPKSEYKKRSRLFVRLKFVFGDIYSQSIGDMIDLLLASIPRNKVATRIENNEVFLQVMHNSAFSKPENGIGNALETFNRIAENGQMIDEGSIITIVSFDKVVPIVIEHNRFEELTKEAAENNLTLENYLKQVIKKNSQQQVFKNK